MFPIAICLVFPFAGPALGHVGSTSHTRIEVSESGVKGMTRLQVLSVLEVLPGLDANEDGFVDAIEVAEASPAIGALFAADYGLIDGGQALEVLPGEARLLPPLPGAFLEIASWIELPWTAGSPAGETLGVWSRLFLETSPDHTDRLTVGWPGRLSVEGLLGLDQAELSIEPGALRWKAWGAAFAAAGWSAGLLLLAATGLLIGVESARARGLHALALALGLAAGAWWAEPLAAAPGGGLLPLVGWLGASYCAIDRAAFGMQRAHVVEALVVALAWGASTRVPIARFELELEPIQARLGPCLFAGACLLAFAAVARRPLGRPARVLVGAAGAVALGRFLLAAFG